MYVRVTKETGQAVYHCDKVYFDQTGDDEHVLQLTIETSEGQRRRMVDKTANEVYLMNDKGQTIDSYRWTPLKEDG